MQIKIEAQDMLHVLVDAGIDATDAKAIIFDLLQLPEAGPERQALLEARRARQAKKKVVVEDLEEDVEYEEDEVDEVNVKKSATTSQDPLKTTRVKRPKRINFSNFGGTASPLK